MNLSYFFKIKGLVFLVLMFLITFNSYAQTIYDQEEDYSTNSDHNDEQYRNFQDGNYKNSYSEEDLYNGGYKVKKHANEANQSSSGGIGSFSIDTRAKFWFNNKRASPANNTPQKNTNKEVGVIDGTDRLGEDGESGFADLNNQDKGGVVYPIDDRKTETAPPPPDEPDIPISSPLLSLFLLVVMIGLGFFYLSNASKI
jgi:hypothetical protein